MFRLIRSTCCFALAIAVVFGLVPADAMFTSRTGHARNEAGNTAVKSLGQLDLAFEAAADEAGSASSGPLAVVQTGFVARGPGFAAAISTDGANLWFRQTRERGARAESLQMRWLGASAEATISAEAPRAARTHYFLGADAARWRADVPQHGRVRVSRVWPGIDAVFYGNQRQLEYDFIVAPGADPSRIRFRFDGARRVAIDGRGDLVLAMAGGELRHRAPVAFQERDGVRVPVHARYRLDRRSGVLTFVLGRYDRSKPLIIDPVLSWATHVAGNDSEQARGIAVDAAGNVYVTGATYSGTLAGTAQYPGSIPNGSQSTFVAKLDPTGRTLLWTAILGGSEGDDPVGIAVDAEGGVYVAGNTASADFPAIGAWQSVAPAARAGFVVKLVPAGNAFAWSTYFGGAGANAVVSAIAVDAQNRVHLAGWSDAPLPGFGLIGAAAGGGSADGFAARLGASGAVLDWGVRFGGAAQDLVQALALGGDGSVFVAGRTGSGDFPVTTGAAQPAYRGPDASGDDERGDAFVAKINAAGTAIDFATLLGGSGVDSARGVAVDTRDRVYLTGSTRSADFPVVGALDTPGTRGGEDAFVARLSKDGGTVEYAVAIGGPGADSGASIAVDLAGNAHVAGITESADFPARNAVQGTSGGAIDGFALKLAPDGTRLVWSTFLGGTGRDYLAGIALDAAGSAHVAGDVDEGGFPSTFGPDTGAWSGVPRDVVVARIGVAATTTSLVASSVAPPAGQLVTFTASVTGDAPSGNVVLYSGTTRVASGVVSNGFATLAPTAMAAGSQEFTAEYVGDQNNGPSRSSRVVVDVPAAVGTTPPPETTPLPGTGTSPTTTVASLSLTTLDEGDPLTASVTVRGTSPTGIVEFRNAGQVLTTTLLRDGTASQRLPDLPVGTHSITAHYAGDSVNAPSVSAPVSVTVFRRTSSKGGGGCAIGGGGPLDPTLLLLIGLAAVGALRRTGHTR